MVVEASVGAASGAASGATAGAATDGRLRACTDTTDLLRGVTSVGAWTVLLRIFDLSSCDDASPDGSRDSGVTLQSADTNELDDELKASGGARDGCCTLRLSLRGCRLQLSGPTADVRLTVQLPRHAHEAEETFVAWSGALTREVPSAVTYRYTPLHTVTYRYIPLHARGTLFPLRAPTLSLDRTASRDGP